MTPSPSTLDDFNLLVPDEAAAVALFLLARWPEGPCCSRCGSFAMTRLTTRLGWWQCRTCRAQTSIRSGTPVHGTHKPLRDWLYAAWKCSTPAGASTRSIAADLEYRYETMWVMVHKIRAALAERGAWPLPGAVALGTAEIPAPKPANGDPEGHPPVLVALAVEAQPEDPFMEQLRFETAATREQTDAALLADTRARHVEVGAEAQIHPTRMDRHPLTQRAPRALHWPYRRIVRWLTAQFGGVSRRYMANYLAQYVYVHNRCPRQERLFEWILRRLATEPWRPRSEMALLAP